MLGCIVDGCAEPVNGHGYCKRHYYRWRRYGDPLAPVLRRGPIGKNETCRVETCERPIHARDLCRMHHHRALRGHDLNKAPRVIQPDRGCSVAGCDRPHVAKDLCRKHYNVAYRHGSATAPGRRKGSIDRKGYRIFRVSGREVKEHRYVMERMLGRPLLPFENVHHINGVRDDNRPENLELWSSSQPSGQRVTDKVAWAIELLQLYAPEVLADRPAQLPLV